MSLQLIPLFSIEFEIVECIAAFAIIYIIIEWNYISFWWFNNVRSGVCITRLQNWYTYNRQKSTPLQHCSMFDCSLFPSNPQAPGNHGKMFYAYMHLSFARTFGPSKLKRHLFMESPTPNFCRQSHSN